MSPKKTAKTVKILPLLASLLILTSCGYDGDFDALSHFPNNGKQLDVREIDLLDVRRGSRAEDFGGSLPPEPENLATTNVIQISENVSAQPYRVPRKEALQEGRFSLVPSSWTGIIDDPYLEFNETNAEKLRSPFTATGLAIGDLTDDGLPDVFVVNQHRGGRLFRNQGDLKFVDITSSVGINIDAMWGTAATLVDINNDGLLDIYLCAYDSPNRLFIRRGRKFVEQASRYGLDFKGACIGASFADFDRDGDLDVYLITNRLPPDKPVGKLPIDRIPGQPPRIKERFRELNHLIESENEAYLPVKSGQYDYLLRNDGYEFVDVTKQVNIGMHPYHGMAAIWFDYNGDNWPDLYVTNDHKDPDQLFENQGPNENGEVTFNEVAEQMFSKRTWFSKGVDVGDLNDDGRMDLLVAGNSDRELSDRVNNRGNLFGRRSDEWFLNWGKMTQRYGNSVTLNVDTGYFVDVGNMIGLGSTNWTSSIRACDLDNDGRQDVLVVNGSTRAFFDNDLNRQLRHALEARTIENSSHFWLDKSAVRSGNMVFRNSGDLQFADMSEQWAWHQGTDVTQVAAVADLDDDGDLDVVTTGYKEKTRVFRNDINSANSIRFRLQGIESNSRSVGAEIRVTVDSEFHTQVQRIHASRALLASEEPTLHFGVGDANTIENVEITWPTGAKQKLHDLESNLLYRVQEPKSTSLVVSGSDRETDKNLFVKEKQIFGKPIGELDYDDFGFQPLLTRKQSQLGPGLAWADIDGDQDYDLFVCGSAFENAKLFINQGNLEFDLEIQDSFRSDNDCEDLGAAFFDCDQDGDQDLYVVSGGVESKAGSSAMQDRLYVNNGRGGFKKSPDALPNLSFSGCCVAAGDFDNDQRVDLFVGGRITSGEYPNSPGSILLRNTGGTFQDVTSEIAPDLKKIGLVNSSVWSDVDGDGKQDLLVATELGPVRCFMNTNGQLKDVTESGGLAQRYGLHHSISTGDVDNDGDIDFVIGNLGLNTPMVATQSDPRLFYYSTFAGFPTASLIEAVRRDGTEYPARSLDSVLEAIPSLEDKFDSSQKFVNTPLNQIFTADELSQAVKRELNSLESGILINESTEQSIKFIFKPLPIMAQASPIFGSQLVDVNGDGNLDLYVLQNNFGIHPRFERQDSGSGLLLMGLGNGDFEPNMVDTGLDVKGDGTALTTVDWNKDARPDFVAATNNEGIHTFTNHSVHEPFSIDLTKIDNQRNHIGARVLIVFNNGQKQLHEIHSHSGYLAQSPPIVFTGLKTSSEIDTIHIQWPDGSKLSGTIESLLNK